MKQVIFASLLSAAAAFAPSLKTSSPKSVVLSSSKAELEELASKLNPVINYFDPLKIGEEDDYTITWFRQAEVKHGRVAMAAFVGYCVQSNWVFPWAETLAGDAHPSPDLIPEMQLDAIPAMARWQILALVGFLETWDESGGDGALPHYTKGRKIGQFPSLRENFKYHWCLDLFDPFGLSKSASEETKERGLVAEINNGRLAMLGMMSFLAANQVEGSVPVLAAIKGAAPGLGAGFGN